MPVCVTLYLHGLAEWFRIKHKVYGIRNYNKRQLLSALMFN